LAGVVTALKVGELSRPVRGRGGWYLLGLQEVAPAALPLARLLLPLPPGAAKEAVDNTMKISMQLRQATNSCATLEKISQDSVLKGSVFMNMGTYPMANLHPDLQKALLETKPGEVAMPVMLDAGVFIFARCD
jgi:parvulin-like peptidyl-prolyl isomerase